MRTASRFSFLPAEPERSDLPNGWTTCRSTVQATRRTSSRSLSTSSASRADEDNQLPRILTGLVRADAGAPGTRHTVALATQAVGVAPDSARTAPRRAAALARYSREEIPPLFGLEFSTAIWNAGFVKRPGHIFLLDDAGQVRPRRGVPVQGSLRRAAREFEWQSQNRTARESADGQDIKNHVERDIAVHLFVRAQKKRPGGGSAPFVYCGDVRFKSWQGERPITVSWQLSVPVPDHIWTTTQAGK